MWRSRHNAAQSPYGTKTPAEDSLVVSFDTITEGLAKTYKEYILQLERDFKFDLFHSPALTDGDFLAKPIVLLLGQYSTGKTTFIRHLLEKDYPGLRIGPEPTTDKFVAVCHSDDTLDSGNAPAQVLPGHAAVVDRNLPWSQLESFGPGFLSRFEVVHVKSHVFKGVTLIDTPGVLAGNKQWERGYDFEGVISWFAERVDSVLIFFDAHKLDISDEFRRCIQALRGYESKVSILLNKADSVNAQHLMRVYGALMWSLGKVMAAPEVPRIYIGSFWDRPLQPACLSTASGVCGRDSGSLETSSRSENAAYGVTKLFEQETDDLFKLIYSLPARSASRKIDDFLKRVKKCYTHCLLIDHLRRQLPQFFGKVSKHKELLDHLDDIYELLSKKYQIPVSDFPSTEFIRSKLHDQGVLYKFPKMDAKKLRETHELVKLRVAGLTKLIPREELNCADMHSPLDLEGFGRSAGSMSPTLWLSARQKIFRAASAKSSSRQRANLEGEVLTARPATQEATVRQSSSLLERFVETPALMVELISEAESVTSESVPAEEEVAGIQVERALAKMLPIPIESLPNPPSSPKSSSSSAASSSPGKGGVPEEPPTAVDLTRPPTGAGVVP